LYASTHNLTHCPGTCAYLKPYLQILWALLILVASCVATAYVSPYEIAFLNALDVGSLFALIVTQIFSIVYFYAETAERPFMNRAALEVLVTLALFVLNSVTLLLFCVAFASEVLGLRSKLRERGKQVLRIVADQHAQRAADPLGEGYWWYHPAGIAVRNPPVACVAEGVDVWIWHDNAAGFAAAPVEPELLVISSIDALVAGDTYRWMHPTTHRVSAVVTKYPEVGGLRCYAHRALNDDDAVDVDANVVARALEFDNPHARDTQDIEATAIVAPMILEAHEVINPASFALEPPPPVEAANPRRGIERSSAEVRRQARFAERAARAARNANGVGIAMSEIHLDDRIQL
jgi:hypothetical protein